MFNFWFLWSMERTCLNIKTMFICFIWQHKMSRDNTFFEKRANWFVWNIFSSDRKTAAQVSPRSHLVWTRYYATILLELALYSNFMDLLTCFKPAADMFVQICHITSLMLSLFWLKVYFFPVTYDTQDFPWNNSVPSFYSTIRANFVYQKQFHLINHNLNSFTLMARVFLTNVRYIQTHICMWKRSCFHPSFN